MNYYQARQRESDKRWDYTQKNDGCIWPVGYCAGYHYPTEQQIKDFHWREADLTKLKANESKYHTMGHATKEEAEECYKQYILDHDVRQGLMHDQQSRCEVCKEWTQRFTEIAHTTIVNLCEQHDTKEEWRKHVHIGQIISSY